MWLYNYTTINHYKRLPSFSGRRTKLACQKSYQKRGAAESAKLTYRKQKSSGCQEPCTVIRLQICSVDDCDSTFHKNMCIGVDGHDYALIPSAVIFCSLYPLYFVLWVTSRTASRIMSTTTLGAVTLGIWSTGYDRCFAFIRSAMKRCVSLAIMRSCSATRK